VWKKNMSVASENAASVIVLDFETTGLSPAQGDRAIEIGAVKIENGIITDSFQALMNPGVRISGFIESYTGISNKMLKSALPCEEVMSEFHGFLGGMNLVAHNASFDSKFLDAEFKRINRTTRGEFACSMLIARRIYQSAPNHKLGTLVKYNNLPNDGTFHRALADSQMTAHLWLGMLNDIKHKHSFSAVPFKVMQKLSRTSKAGTNRFLSIESGVSLT
jgi:DNA polymerase-3 subunit epsilon